MKFTDFGVDLDDLMRLNRGVLIPSFAKYRDVDVLAGEKLDQRTKEIMKKKMRVTK